VSDHCSMNRDEDVAEELASVESLLRSNDVAVEMTVVDLDSARTAAGLRGRMGLSSQTSE